MPQVDLEALVSVCGGSDRKVACETLADGKDECSGGTDHIPDSVAPDFPPESFWLSKDAEFDWFDRNAFLERKESTKRSSYSTNLNPNVNQHYLNSNSQRYSVNLKQKAGIIGLPKTNYVVDSKRRHCKPVNTRLFPKNRSQSVGKASAVSATEPSSPKVSCMGRVRSKRCRSRRKLPGPVAQDEKLLVEARTERGQKAGLFSRLTSLLRSDGNRRRKDKNKNKNKSKNKSAVQVEGLSEESAPRRSVTRNAREQRPSAEPVADPPALGGMKRFASGRRSGSWGAEDFDVASRDSFDLGRRAV